MKKKIKKILEKSGVGGKVAKKGTPLQDTLAYTYKSLKTKVLFATKTDVFTQKQKNRTLKR